jgi:DNA-binding NtrC family response regulator
VKRVLVIDDEPNVRTVLTMLLEDDGYEVLAAENGEAGIAILEDGPSVDLVITDLKMPGKDGMAVLRHMREIGREAPLVMVTAYGSIEKAVEAMKGGAVDFITKPFNKDVIRHIVHKILTADDLRRENELLRQDCGAPGLIARSRTMREVAELVDKVAGAPSAILILGESGTGKEVVARAIHARAAAAAGGGFSVPFVSINCPAVPDTLIESELFGYRKGAFTGASGNFAGKLSQARGGVLFLDEIAEIPLPTQAKLLRFIEEKVYEPLGSTVKTRVDARIICATNKELEQLVQEGRFREDLFYRINTITLRIPPLRERVEDILPLAEHFLAHYSSAMGRKTNIFSEDVRAILCAHSWPGNVRELRNVIERAVVLSTGEQVTTASLPQELVRGPRPEAIAPGGKLEAMEKAALAEAMRRHGGNVSSAARDLGISRDTLRYRIRKYGLPSG